MTEKTRSMASTGVNILVRAKRSSRMRDLRRYGKCDNVSLKAALHYNDIQISGLRRGRYAEVDLIQAQPTGCQTCKQDFGLLTIHLDRWVAA
jgi:hypothetical protein